MSDITKTKAVLALAALVGVFALCAGYLVASDLLFGGEEDRDVHHRAGVVEIDAMGAPLAEPKMGKGAFIAPRDRRQELERRCAAGDTEGCYGLGLLWRDGVGGDRSAGEARRLVSKACRQGHAPACSLVPLLPAE